MKIIEVKKLAIPEIKIIKYGRFKDHRGYFTETLRKSDFANLDFMKDVDFLQCNESFSKPGTIRGLHYQWNPFMGKLVRVVQGKMVDLVLDIRKNSPTFGKIIGYEMTGHSDLEFNEWIWVPPGFAHGNFFTEHTTIEYFCSGSYNPECEAGISPYSKDIDWSECDGNIKSQFDSIKEKGALITEKDQNGFTLESWTATDNSNQFIY